MSLQIVKTFCDGGSRGNPGPASIGVVIKDGQGNVHARISRTIGTATNNQAEYRAVIAALGRVGIPATSRASFYLYNTKDEVDLLVNGIYKVKEIFG